ncbi:MAG: PEP/pyruvate-binding domain-containing protein [Clostridia bacterium]
MWLGEPESSDPSLVGGKAAALSRLHSRFPVPPGFVLPWSVFRPDGSLTVGDLAEAYDQLGANSVAVRSSAVGEDGQEASFAGQHATLLHVRDLDALRAAVYACWASAQSEPALRYREHQGMDGEGPPRIAVLVQAMVRADAAAVGFSRAPAGHEPDVMLINASFGLGDSIVSGLVTPDVYAVYRGDLSIVRQDVAEKGIMTVIAADGVTELAVPTRLRRRPALAEDQIRELAALMQDLEREWRFPVDVEVAWDADGLHLLQCRPITAL